MKDSKKSLFCVEEEYIWIQRNVYSVTVMSRGAIIGGVNEEKIYRFLRNRP